LARIEVGTSIYRAGTQTYEAWATVSQDAVFGAELTQIPGVVFASPTVSVYVAMSALIFES
jgi:hypothetical protein